MPWGDWATAFPRQIIPSLIPIILFSICTQSNTTTSSSSSRSNGIGEGGGGVAVVGRRLHCLSCVRVEGDTTMLDQFRVRHGLLQPYCDMEAVQCDLHQDACVTITMQISQRRFWVGSGCDQRVNYDFPSGGREGCVEMPAVYRNFHPGFMEERRTLQRVCLCSGNLCNSAQPLKLRRPFLPILTTISALIPSFILGTFERAMGRH
ncbi:hypothetical protein GPALN_007985 [Globodera pallida]|nr:hypothetical protein GPALN_007985 [Globodera pallida]